ncbi:hypothetical protein WMY93_031790 [Mugilogobius chulae]|uniref:Uncharacterized protein n=1 Tax=Mugilogobius chulae TaxID=88201 RepID=A0AAW0MET5_9GOBI
MVHVNSCMDLCALRFFDIRAHLYIFQSFCPNSPVSSGTRPGLPNRASPSCLFRKSTVCRASPKPEVYRTVDGKIVVDNELLNFLTVKAKTLSQDEIVLLAANTFTSDWIESSKKILFEVCSTTQRNISHVGAHKDINNIKSYLKVINECGENIPRFVSHYLDEMPPVSFSSLDVCGLLRKMELLQADIGAMKSALEIQTDMCANLRAITADVNDRVFGLATRWTGREQRGQERDAVTTQDPEAAGGAAGCLGVCEEEGAPLQRAEGANKEEILHPPGSPKWSTVLKNGRRQPGAKSGARPVPPVARRPAKQLAIVGTGVSSHIKTVTTKMKRAVRPSGSRPDSTLSKLRDMEGTYRLKSHLVYASLPQDCCLRCAAAQTCEGGALCAKMFEGAFYNCMDTDFHDVRHPNITDNSSCLAQNFIWKERTFNFDNLLQYLEDLMEICFYILTGLFVVQLLFKTLALGVRNLVMDRLRPFLFPFVNLTLGEMFEGAFYNCMDTDFHDVRHPNITDNSSCLAQNFIWKERTFNFDNLLQNLVGHMVPKSHQERQLQQQNQRERSRVPQGGDGPSEERFFIFFMTTCVLLLNMFIGTLVDTWF